MAAADEAAAADAPKLPNDGTEVADGPDAAAD